MINVILNDQEVDRLCADLKIERPPIHFRVTPGELVYGTASRLTRRVEIRVGLREFTDRPLSYVKAQVNRTLLHELRHIFQFTHWNTFSELEMETDARAFEDEKLNVYSLVKRISRKAIVPAGLKAIR